MCNSRSSLVNIHFYRIWKPSEGYPFSTKLVPRDHHAVVTRFLHFKVKTKNGKRKFKRTLEFLFVDEGKLFIKKSSFEEFNLVFFTAERMVCFKCNQGSYFQVRFAPYGQENYVFEREFMHVYSYIFFFGAEEKLQNAPRFEMDFVLNFAMWTTDFTCVNGSTIEIVFSELF